MFLALPVTSGLWVRGGWYAVGGVILSFFACWIVLTPVVIWVYRYVAPGRPEWLATVLVGSFTAANLSGFLHGFVLFCSLPLDLGVPFGGFTEIGGMVAVGLWLYLFHTILLAGYAATRSASAYQRARRARPRDPEPDDAPAQRPHRRDDRPRAGANSGALKSDAMTSLPARADVVIIGAGHNGLVSAILLARAGLRRRRARGRRRARRRHPHRAPVRQGARPGPVHRLVPARA